MPKKKNTEGDKIVHLEEITDEKWRDAVEKLRNEAIKELSVVKLAARIGMTSPTLKAILVGKKPTLIRQIIIINFLKTLEKN